MVKFIYHVVSPSYFKTFEGKEDYYPLRFEEEGFIHNCFEESFDYVFNTHFKGIDEVLILKIDPSKIKAQIIIEGDQHPMGFPHIYGPINMDAIINTQLKQLTN